MGAAGGDGAGEDESDGVSQHFEDDDPPRVVGFHACLLSLLRVGQDGVDLLFAEFDFHDLVRVKDEWLLNLTGRFRYRFCCRFRYRFRYRFQVGLK